MRLGGKAPGQLGFRRGRQASDRKSGMKNIATSNAPARNKVRDKTEEKGKKEKQKRNIKRGMGWGVRFALILLICRGRKI